MLKIEEQLASIMPYLMIVWYYNPTTGQWQLYDPTDLPGSDLTVLADGQRYFIKVSLPCEVFYCPGSNSKPLYHYRLNTDAWNRIIWEQEISTVTGHADVTIGTFTTPTTIFRGQDFSVDIPISWSIKNEYFPDGLPLWIGAPNHIQVNLYLDGNFFKQVALYLAYEHPELNALNGNAILPTTVHTSDLPKGQHNLSFRVVIVAQWMVFVEHWVWYIPFIRGYNVSSPTGEILYGYAVATSTKPVTIEDVITAAFSVDKISFTVPFTAQFTDKSTYVSGYPIRSWLWDFGDGVTSGNQNPTHEYVVPGTYTVKLTVTNALGSSTASMTIQANEAPVHPQFSPDCWFPLSVDVNEEFTPKVIIQNTGGPGNIYLYYMVKGTKVSVFDSHPIDARSTYDVDLGTHTISYFLGYTPTQSEMVTITFYTGPVGQNYTGMLPETIGVSVGGITPPPGGGGISPIVYVVGGAAVIAIAAIAYQMLKKK